MQACIKGATSGNYRGDHRWLGSVVGLLAWKQSHGVAVQGRPYQQQRTIRCFGRVFAI